MKILNVAILPYEMLNFIVIEKKLNKNFQEEKILEHYINMLPLIMACSIKRGAEDKCLKACKKSLNETECPKEYYIPQLLTKWIVHNYDIYDGIEYFSNEVPTHSRKNYKLYHNLVIFTQRIGNEEYDRKLLSKLKLTKPVRVKENIDLFSEYGEEDNSFLNQKKIPVRYNIEEFYHYTDSEGIYPFRKASGRISNEKTDEGEVHYGSSGFSLIELDLSKETADYIIE